MSTTFPDRLVLEGVPRVAFYAGGPRCPEDIPYASCLRAVAEYLHELPGFQHLDWHTAGSPILCAYAWYLGLTGQAFSNVWEPGWLPGNGDIRYIAADPAEPLVRGLEAIGRPGAIYVRGQRWAEEGTLRRELAACLTAGRPAIGIGLAGPPEPALITGYDEGGDVLIGWSFFQDMPEFNGGLSFEPGGEFRARDWFRSLEALILPGERAEIPPLQEQVHRALRSALEHIRTPMLAGRHTGLAAYDAWASHLLRDADFDVDDPALLYERFTVHDQSVGNIAEFRWYGAVFLSEAACAGVPRDADLLRAAACMAEEHALMWQVWELVSGIGREPEKALKLAEPQVRRDIAEVLRASRDRCAEMARLLERALA